MSEFQLSAINEHSAWSSLSESEEPNLLAEEVPVALVFNGTTAAVMMTSPQDIEDFAVGFAITEGIISSVDDISELEVLAHESGIEARFWLTETPGATFLTRRRAMLGPIGCGLCGLDSLDQAVRDLPVLPMRGLAFSTTQIDGATEALRALQPLHDTCHAVHAAGYLDAQSGILDAREDVGRHNALDKLIGARCRKAASVSEGGFVITSRVSVDMVQKTVLAGCALLIAVSAPTAHAVRLAQASQLTLVAKARGKGFHIYATPERLAGIV